jgi:hypothetical protein
MKAPAALGVRTGHGIGQRRKLVSANWAGVSGSEESWSLVSTQESWLTLLLCLVLSLILR